MSTTTLFRPGEPIELELIRQSGWRAFPPRLPEQPIFYPVLNEQYAHQIARDWNVLSDGAGFVTKFEVNSEFLARFPVKTVGASVHTAFWKPAEDLEELNKNIVGMIAVIAAFRAEKPA